jgi:hypothetical protein
MNPQTLVISPRKTPNDSPKSPKLKKAAFEALRKHGGRLRLDQLAKILDRTPSTIYKVLPSWPEITFDKGRSLLSLKLTQEEWAELFYRSNEGNGTYPGTFAIYTDSEIVVRRIAGQVAGRLGMNPQNKKLARIVREVLRQHMENSYANMGEYLESLKPKNERAFLKALPSIKPPRLEA